MEEKKKRKRKGLGEGGKINEWMTDAMDRSPLTEETDGDFGMATPPDQNELDFPTVAAVSAQQQHFRFHTPGKAGRVTILGPSSAPR